MSEAISSHSSTIANPFGAVFPGMPISAKDGLRRPEQLQAPNDAVIKSSLQKQGIFDVDLYPMPMPQTPVQVQVQKQAGELALSKLAAVSDYIVSRQGLAQSSQLQTSNIEQARSERQLADSAVDLIVGNETDREECRPLANFCKAVFLDLHVRISMMKFHAPSNSGEVSSAARQLEQWTQESDIGLEILRMFIATWNQIRHSLRAERQFEIGELQRLSAQAVAELLKQGQDKFQQEALNAWASIASSAVQLVPIGIHTAVKAHQARNEKMLTFNVGEETIGAAGDSEYVKATKRHARAQEFGNVLQISRSFGEGVQGIMNLFAAYEGLAAAKDNAAYTKYSNQIQIEIMKIENLNVRGEDAWQKIMQILSSMLERQNRLHDMNVRNTRA